MSGRESIVVTLRLAGQKAFAAGAGAASKSLRGIGTAADTAGKRTGAAGKHAVTAGAAFGGLAGLARNGALALGAAGVAAAGVGVKFDAGMEQSRVAFTNLLGSGKEANAMLSDLYEVAKNTPFEFPQLTQASQKLLGFGLQAKDVIPDMTAIGDAVAGVGGGSEQIERITTALGQIQAKGKVSSEELMQMAESGVPAFKLLGDQMGLTGEQLTKKLKAGAIGADKGIDAIIAGINKKYGGMAEAQSKTFNGMLSSMKDSATQILGRMFNPLFEGLRDHVMPQISKALDWISTTGAKAFSAGQKQGLGPATEGYRGVGKMLVWIGDAMAKVRPALRALSAGFKKGAGSATEGYTGFKHVFVVIGNVARKVLPALSAGFKFARRYVAQMFDALKPMAPLFQNVLIPFFKGFVKGALGGLVGMLKLAIPIVRIIAKVLGWLGEKAAPLRGVFQFLGTVVGFIFGPSKFGKALTMLPKVGKIFLWLGGKLRFIGRAFTGFKDLLAKVIGGIGGALLRRLGSVFGTIARFLGRIPGKWLDLGKRAAQALLRGIIHVFSAATGLAGSIGGSITKWINDHTPFGDRINLPRPLPDFTLPALAGGGPVNFNGAALVGEQGPEIVTLRKGMNVVPNDGLGATVAGGVRHVTIRAPVYLDRRQVAEAVGSYNADQRARA